MVTRGTNELGVPPAAIRRGLRKDDRRITFQIRQVPSKKRLQREADGAKKKRIVLHTGFVQLMSLDCYMSLLVVAKHRENRASSYVLFVWPHMPANFFLESYGSAEVISDPLCPCEIGNSPIIIELISRNAHSGIASIKNKNGPGLLERIEKTSKFGFFSSQIIEHVRQKFPQYEHTADEVMPHMAIAMETADVPYGSSFSLLRDQGPEEEGDQEEEEAERNQETIEDAGQQDEEKRVESEDETGDNVGQVQRPAILGASVTGEDATGKPADIVEGAPQVQCPVCGTAVYVFSGRVSLVLVGPRNLSM